VSEGGLGQTPTGDCLPGLPPKSDSYLQWIDRRLDEAVVCVEVLRPVVFGLDEMHPDTDIVRNFDALSMKPKQSHVQDFSRTVKSCWRSVCSSPAGSGLEK